MLEKHIKLLTLEEINERFDVAYIRRLIQYVDEKSPNKLVNTHYSHGLLNELSVYEKSENKSTLESDVVNNIINENKRKITEVVYEPKKDVIEIPRELYEQLMKHIKPNE